MKDTPISRETIPPKVFNFAYFAALAALYPFLPLFYEDLGLTGRQIGVLIGVLPLVTTVSASLWGALADASGRHTLFLKVTILGAVAGAVLIYLSSTFWGLFPSVIVFSLFSTPIVPLVDNTIFSLLGEDSDRYGQFRLWGSIGWGIGAPAVGTVVQRAGLSWAFFLYVLLMGITLITAFQMRIRPAGIGGDLREGLRLLLGNRVWIQFLAALFIAGMGLAVVDNFLFLHLRGLGASESLMGITLSVGTASEVVLFISSERVLAKLGRRTVLSIAIIALITQLLTYSFLKEPWLALLIQALHGPSFGGLWLASVSFANKMAPEGMGATAQGLISTVLLGLGASAGSLLGGQLMDLGGSSLAFFWSGILTILALAIILITRVRARRAVDA